MDRRKKTDDLVSRFRSVPFSAVQNQDWQGSNTPTSYAWADSPEPSQYYDPDPSVRPLFAGKANQTTMTGEKSSSKRETGIPVFRRSTGSRLGGSLGKSFADKAAKAGMSGLGIVSNARPPWKGASGRHNPLTPISDAPNSTTLPRRDGAISPIDEAAAQEGTTYLTVRHGKVSPVDPDADTVPSTPVSQVSSISGMNADDARPPVPLKGKTNANEPKSFMPKQFSVRGSPWRSRSRKDRTLSADVANALNETPIMSTFPGDLEREVLGESIQQPRSRFSWSTRATESVMGETPEIGSPQEKVPALPTQSPNGMQSPQNNGQNPPSPPSPIMNRRHPMHENKPSTGDAVIKRKPVGSRPSIEVERPSIGSAKDLPLSPDEAASVDLVTALEAQGNDLARRRMNLQRIINSMTALQPQNPVIQDLEKRRKHQQRVDRVEQELAEVKRKEHEVGLRLHRAWKRRDQDAPTALWVRRVTA